MLPGFTPRPSLSVHLHTPRKKLAAATLHLLEGGGECSVLPRNWDAVRLFAASATQWRRRPSGVLAALDYRGVQSLAEGMEVAWNPETVGALREMEAAVLERLSGE